MEATHRQVQFQTVGRGLLVRAPAKINLSLLVAGKRSDGFHEIETVIAKLAFYDEVLIEQGEMGGIELVCKGSCWAPEGPDNLVYKACELAMGDLLTGSGVKVTLTKNIPAGSGLGSGSSDAAAALMGVNKFFKLGIEPERLLEMAGRLGSDTAFFLNGPAALCTGRGEKIRRLPEVGDFLVLLMIPNVSVSTKRVYANYVHRREQFEELSVKIRGLIGKNRIDLVWKMCANMLAKSCFALYKELAQLKSELESSGIGPVCLSGSGSAMFTIIENGDKSTARQKRHKLEGITDCNSIIVSSNRW